MHCFITVGTTQFDGLVLSVLSEASCSALRKIGITDLVIQAGSGANLFKNFAATGGNTFDFHELKVTIFDYKDNIQADMAKADLIIGHAGAGTSLEALRLGKPFIAVINTALMNDHQRELANKLSSLGCIIATTLKHLPDTLENFSFTSLKPFVIPEMKPLANAVDSLVGLC
uniref:UDP-N-acetylglucosamine transferase subunit ALG13 n=1 Tax=Syphacia muris TaxID=451379 RepID=A0A0N5AWI8_9BILA